MSVCYNTEFFVGVVVKGVDNAGCVGVCGQAFARGTDIPFRGCLKPAVKGLSGTSFVNVAAVSLCFMETEAHQSRLLHSSVSLHLTAEVSLK